MALGGNLETAQGRVRRTPHWLDGGQEVTPELLSEGLSVHSSSSWEGADMEGNQALE